MGVVIKQVYIDFLYLAKFLNMTTLSNPPAWFSTEEKILFHILKRR
jgi:hypothetical protein